MSNYNTLSMLSDIPYNAIAYLMDNSELIFRLLRYNDSEAYRLDASHPNLSQAEKGALIYDGKMLETDARLFMTTGMDYAWTVEACQLRISIVEVRPTNYILGNILLGMEIYPHFKISQLSNYKTRQDMIAQELVRVFNGAEIGGLGKLFFDISRSPYCKISVIGNSPFVGKSVTFCNWIV